MFFTVCTSKDTKCTCRRACFVCIAVVYIVQLFYVKMVFKVCLFMDSL